MLKKIFLIISILIIFYCKNQLAEEILIYADSISYDEEKNIIAKGNAKIISENEIITSDLIIHNNKDKKYILPLEFKFKDKLNNYYYGSSGEFSENLENANINDIKIHLNDGTRIVGNYGIRKGKIDLIDKATYSPCLSRINIKKFKCPIWQIDGEKVLHDSEKLFLYQKHAKMKIFNVPVFYLPYLVTPSPLRKKRKSGFLAPTISFNFLDVQVSQNISFPYYFNLDIDKELFFTPYINYGGGVNSSQRFNLDYNQIISGGNLNIDLSTNTTFENENNEHWFQNASLITSYKQNINEKFNIGIGTAFQTSQTYLKENEINNKINRNVALTSSLALAGYNLIEEYDVFSFNISSYQVVQSTDNNKHSPTTFPFIKYVSSNKKFNNFTYQNKYNFYNIFRDSATSTLAQRQQKLSYNFSSDYEIIKLKSKINFKTELLSQIYNIENKPIDSNNFTGTYSRIFPMSGLYIETPFRNSIYDININPHMSFIINGSQTSSNKISNEESGNTALTLMTYDKLNRFVGSDKLDNSKRVNYGIEIIKNKFYSEISQSYEFDAKSNYNKEVGLKDYMSDALFSAKYEDTKYKAYYNNRMNVDQGKIASQSLALKIENNIGIFGIGYSEAKKETNSILTKGSEAAGFSVSSKTFKKFNNISFSANYDLINDYYTKYDFKYSYLDECFSIDLNFGRSNYQDRNLKPQDTLTLMFSFKNIGSFKSENLAVSEEDKQDIEWAQDSIDNQRFLPITNND